MPMSPLPRRPPVRSQRGAAAIEMALVFGLLFGLLWAIISYTFPLLLIHAMNRSVTEAARVGATVDTNADEVDWQSAVEEVTLQELQAQMDWLPDGWIDTIEPDDVDNVSFAGSADCPAARPNCVLTVRLLYANYRNDPVIPAIALPIVGQIPPLPEKLEAIAQVAL